jgi:tetratricopeptide (TPR) repeat protein
VLAQAHYLLISGEDGWNPTDHRDASYVYAEAARKMIWVKPTSELLPWAERAVEQAGKAGKRGRRAMSIALRAEADLLGRLGDMKGSEESLEEARELTRQGDPALLASILQSLSETARYREDLGRARELLREALSLFAHTHSKAGEAGCKYELSVLAMIEEDYSSAHALNEEALALFSGLGLEEAAMTSVHHLAHIELRQGDLDAARSHAEEALRYQVGIGKTYSEASCRRLLADIERHRGNLEIARSSAETALALLQGIENRQAEPGALLSLALAVSACGERSSADELFRKAAGAYRRLGNETRAVSTERYLAADAQ